MYLPFKIEDIKELLGQVNDGVPEGFVNDDEEILEKYLSHRSARFTMKDEISNGKFPDGEGGLAKTRRFLDSYMEKLATTDL